MLKSLHFKNWRTLRDVHIPALTPLTVFVGANSSGKTNIIDALHFASYAAINGVRPAIFAWKGLQELRTQGSNDKEPVNISLTYKFKRQHPFTEHIHLSEMPKQSAGSNGKQFASSDTSSGRFLSRWQILRENFLTPSTSVKFTPSSFDRIDTQAQNVPYLLKYMQEDYPDIYSELEQDLKWLLHHVDSLDTIADEEGTKLAVSEAFDVKRDALTISTGTLRIIAMLTAYYLLEIKDADKPGLIAIEEPDTALHPLLLSKFVSLLRSYTLRDDRPRQFLLTTHNPLFLNLFKPEEVRIVERDEQGDTVVNRVNQEVVEVWREADGAYNLGDLWTTRLLGGVPE